MCGEQYSTEIITYNVWAEWKFIRPSGLRGTFYEVNQRAGLRGSYLEPFSLDITPVIIFTLLGTSFNSTSNEPGTSAY